MKSNISTQGYGRSMTIRYPSGILYQSKRRITPRTFEHLANMQISIGTCSSFIWRTTVCSKDQRRYLSPFTNRSSVDEFYSYGHIIRDSDGPVDYAKASPSEFTFQFIILLEFRETATCNIYMSSENKNLTFCSFENCPLQEYGHIYWQCCRQSDRFAPSKIPVTDPGDSFSLIR